MYIELSIREHRCNVPWQRHSFWSRQTAAIIRWRETGPASESRGERTRLAIAQAQPNLGDRGSRHCQQHLGSFDATQPVVSARRPAERLLERPAEMMRAKPGEIGKCGEGDLFSEMLFDILDDHSLLPSRKSTARRS